MEPVYKSKDGQVISQSDLINSGYSKERIDKGVSNGVLTQVADTKDTYISKDGQTVTYGDLLESGYSHDRILKGIETGILKKKDGGSTSPQDQTTSTPSAKDFLVDTKSSSNPQYGFKNGQWTMPQSFSEDPRILDFLVNANKPKQQPHVGAVGDPVKNILTPVRQQYDKANKLHAGINQNEQLHSESTLVNTEGGIAKQRQLNTQAAQSKDDLHEAANRYTGALSFVNGMFSNGKEAGDYLNNVAKDNDGKLPDNNETVNLAQQKFNDYKSVEDDVVNKYGSIRMAALAEEKKNNPLFADQMNAIAADNNGNPVTPDIREGNIVRQYIAEHGKDLDALAEQHPDQKDDWDNLKNNFINLYPTTSAFMIGNEVSRAREAAGMNNGIYNPHTNNFDKETDAIAEQLFKNDPQKLNLYRTEVALNKSKYIDTPGFVEKGINRIGQFIQGVGNIPNDISASTGLVDPDMSTGILGEMRKQDELVTSDPKGWHYFTATAGDFSGLIASMAAGGSALKALGLNPLVADKVMTGLTFYDSELKNALMKYPNSQLKATTVAGLNTTLYGVLGNIFPATKLQQVFEKAKPEMENAIKYLDNTAISAEAARNKLNETFTNIIHQYATGASEMVALNQFNQGLDKMMGIKGAAYDTLHPEGETADVVKSMAAGNLLPSIIIGASSVRKSTIKDNIWEMANNPKRFDNVLSDLRDSHPEQATEIQQRLANLSFIAKTKVDLDENTSLSDAQKKNYLLQAVNERNLSQKAAQVEEPKLNETLNKDILSSQTIKQDILNGQEGTDVLPQEKRVSVQMPNEVAKPDIVDNIPQAEMPETKDTKNGAKVVLPQANRKPDVVTDVERVPKEEYDAFIDKNDVSDERLNDIASKVKNQQPLSEREIAIFHGKTSEINDIISQSEKKPSISVTQPRKPDVVELKKSVDEGSDNETIIKNIEERIKKGDEITANDVIGLKPHREGKTEFTDEEKAVFKKYNDKTVELNKTEQSLVDKMINGDKVAKEDGDNLLSLRAEVEDLRNSLPQGTKGEDKVGVQSFSDMDSFKESENINDWKGKIVDIGSILHVVGNDGKIKPIYWVEYNSKTDSYEPIQKPDRVLKYGDKVPESGEFTVVHASPSGKIEKFDEGKFGEGWQREEGDWERLAGVYTNDNTEFNKSLNGYGQAHEYNVKYDKAISEKKATRLLNEREKEIGKTLSRKEATDYIRSLGYDMAYRNDGDGSYTFVVLDVNKIEPKEKAAQTYPIGNDFNSFKDHILEQITNVKNKDFDFGIQTSLDMKTTEQALRNLREGKDTKAAQALTAAIQKMYDDGHVALHRGRGGNYEAIEIPIKDYMETVNKEHENPVKDTYHDLDELNTILGEDSFNHAVESDYNHVVNNNNETERTAGIGENTTTATGKETVTPKSPDNEKSTSKTDKQVQGEEPKPEPTKPAAEPKPTANPTGKSEPNEPSKVSEKPSKFTEKLRSLADKIEKGEVEGFGKGMEGVQKQGAGFDFNKAIADAIRFVADAIDTGKDVAKSIEDGWEKVRQHYKDNGAKFNDEAGLKQKFADLFSEEKKAGEGRNAGIRHESLKTMAERLGFDEPKRGTHIDPEALADEGRRLLKEGADPYGVLNPNEELHWRIAISRAHLEDLTKATDKAEEKYGIDSEEYKAAQKAELDYITDYAKPLGTKGHYAFTALQGERNIDEGNFVSVKRAAEESRGKPLNKQEQEQAKKLAEQVAAKDKENEKLRQQLDDALDKLSKRQEQERTDKRKYSESAKKAANWVRRNLKTKPFKFRDENGNEIEPFTQGIKWNDMVEVAAQAIEKSGDIADGIAAVVDKIKDADWYQKLSSNDKQRLHDQLTQHFDDATNNSPEAKNIRRLEKQLEDLQNGNTKKKGAKREPTAREKELQQKIKAEKEKYGIVPVKKQAAPKPVKDEVDLVERFADKKDNKFTPEESKAMWKYAKENYIDNNPNFKVANMVNSLSTDFGLMPEQIRHALAVSPETRKITNDMYRNQYERTRAAMTVRQWVNKEEKSFFSKLIDGVAAPFRSTATFAHGHALLFTHAAPNLFDPKVFKIFVNLAAKQFKVVYGKEEHFAKFVADMKNDPLYNTALKAGLPIDPNTIYDDWQIANHFLAKMKLNGNKGFAVLKALRLGMFKVEYAKLSAVEKADPKAVKTLAKQVSLWTGTAGIKPSATTNAFVFAPNLIVSKFGRIVAPVEALTTLTKMLAGKEISNSQRVQMKISLQKTGRIMAVYAGALGGNAALLALAGSKQQINFTNPYQNDWLKFKTGNNTVDLSGGLNKVMQTLIAVGSLPFASKKEIPEDYYGAKSADEALKNEIYGYLHSTVSPFGGTAWDLISHRDWQGNVLPFYNDNPKGRQEKLSVANYLAEKLPIPVAEAWKTIHDKMREEGADGNITKQIIGGMIMMGFTSSGVKIGNNPKERPTPFNDEDKKNPVVKWFTERGMELPNVQNRNEVITDKENGTKLKVTDYPKEKQDEYTKVHKEYLLESLSNIKDDGIVYVRKYKDGQGEPIVEVKLKNDGDSEEKSLDKLSKDEMAQVLSLAQKSATKKAKKEVFASEED